MHLLKINTWTDLKSFSSAIHRPWKRLDSVKTCHISDWSVSVNTRSLQGGRYLKDDPKSSTVTMKTSYSLWHNNTDGSFSNSCCFHVIAFSALTLFVQYLLPFQQLKTFLRNLWKLIIWKIYKTSSSATTERWHDTCFTLICKIVKIAFLARNWGTLEIM